MHRKCLLFLAILGVAACDDPVPSQEEAREAYAANRELLNQLDTDMRAAVATIPWMVDFRCQLDEAAIQALPPEQQLTAAQVQCEQQRSGRQDEEDIGVLRFRDEWLPQRLTGPIVGLHVSYVPQGAPEQAPALLGEIGQTTLGRRRLAESGTGERIDDRNVEWGAYQPSAEGTGASADAEELPGIRVQWNFPHSRSTFTVTAMLAIPD